MKDDLVNCLLNLEQAYDRLNDRQGASKEVEQKGDGWPRIRALIVALGKQFDEDSPPPRNLNLSTAIHSLERVYDRIAEEPGAARKCTRQDQPLEKLVHLAAELNELTRSKTSDKPAARPEQSSLASSAAPIQPSAEPSFPTGGRQLYRGLSLQCATAKGLPLVADKPEDPRKKLTGLSLAAYDARQKRKARHD